jgi:uncharacterized protein (DUF3084 family)
MVYETHVSDEQIILALDVQKGQIERRDLIIAAQLAKIKEQAERIRQLETDITRLLEDVVASAVVYE